MVAYVLRTLGECATRQSARLLCISITLIAASTFYLIFAINTHTAQHSKATKKKREKKIRTSTHFGSKIIWKIIIVISSLDISFVWFVMQSTTGTHAHAPTREREKYSNNLCRPLQLQCIARAPCAHTPHITTRVIRSRRRCREEEEEGKNERKMCIVSIDAKEIRHFKHRLKSEETHTHTHTTPWARRADEDKKINHTKPSKLPMKRVVKLVFAFRVAGRRNKNTIFTWTRVLWVVWPTDRTRLR